MVSRDASPLVSVVVPNFNGAKFLETCLTSLEQQTFKDFELLIVDNASEDNSLEIVRRKAPSALVVRQSRNTGFAAAANAGIRSARGEWIAALNNDTEVAHTWLEELYAATSRHPLADFFASRILDFVDRKKIYSAGDCFLRIGVGYRRGQEMPDGDGYHEEIKIFSACGCGALYRKSTLEAFGGFDERFFAYLEDVDLGLRLQAAGMQGYYVPSAVLYHRGGGTSGGEFSPLAVRLLSRNSILLLIKNIPYWILARCGLRILARQASWLIRVLAHLRLGSYLRGLAGILPLIPSMLRERASQRKYWKESPNRLWETILDSEALARRDYQAHPIPSPSRFLSWYFERFR